MLDQSVILILFCRLIRCCLILSFGCYCLLSPSWHSSEMSHGKRKLLMTLYDFYWVKKRRWLCCPQMKFLNMWTCQSENKLFKYPKVQNFGSLLCLPDCRFSYLFIFFYLFIYLFIFCKGLVSEGNTTIYEKVYFRSQILVCLSIVEYLEHFWHTSIARKCDIYIL